MVPTALAVCYADSSAGSTQVFQLETQNKFECSGPSGLRSDVGQGRRSNENLSIVGELLEQKVANQDADQGR